MTNHKPRQARIYTFQFKIQIFFSSDQYSNSMTEYKVKIKSSSNSNQSKSGRKLVALLPYETKQHKQGVFICKRKETVLDFPPKLKV